MWPVLVDASCRLAYIVRVHPIFLALDTGQSLETEELELGYSVVQGETDRKRVSDIRI